MLFFLFCKYILVLGPSSYMSMPSVWSFSPRLTHLIHYRCIYLHISVYYVYLFGVDNSCFFFFFFNFLDDLDKLVKFSTQYSWTAQRWVFQQGYFLLTSIFLIFDFHQAAEKVVIRSFLELVLLMASWMHWDTHASH